MRMGLLNHPARFGCRAGMASVTSGGVRSSLTVALPTTVFGPAPARQIATAPAVSAVNVWGGHVPAHDGLTVQLTVTSDRYQPEQFPGAGEHAYVTCTAGCGGGGCGCGGPGWGWGGLGWGGLGCFDAAGAAAMSITARATSNSPSARNAPFSCPRWPMTPPPRLCPRTLSRPYRDGFPASAARVYSVTRLP